MRAKEHISEEIRQALIAYRDHRDNQKVVKWDKEGDCAILFNLWKEYCEKNGWRWASEAICGTFWLKYNDGKSSWNIIMVSADKPDCAEYTW